MGGLSLSTKAGNDTHKSILQGKEQFSITSWVDIKLKYICPILQKVELQNCSRVLVMIDCDVYSCSWVLRVRTFTCTSRACNLPTCLRLFLHSTVRYNSNWTFYEILSNYVTNNLTLYLTWVLVWVIMCHTLLCHSIYYSMEAWYKFKKSTR